MSESNGQRASWLEEVGNAKSYVEALFPEHFTVYVKVAEWPGEQGEPMEVLQLTVASTVFASYAVPLEDFKQANHPAELIEAIGLSMKEGVLAKLQEVAGELK